MFVCLFLQLLLPAGVCAAVMPLVVLLRSTLHTLGVMVMSAESITVAAMLPSYVSALNAA